jgi:hypothetical protein
MKNLILLIFLSTISSNTKCKGIKKGVFISIDKNLGKTVIQRNDTIQLEQNKKLGTLFLQKIKWIDDCNYIIYETKDLINEANLDMSKSTFRVTFKESKNNIYKVSVLVEPVNFRLDMKVEKIRNRVDDDFYDIIKKYSKKE